MHDLDMFLKGFNAVLCLAALGEVGGIPELFDKYSKATAKDANNAFYFDAATGTNKSCGLPREDFAHFFRDAATGDIPWTGTVTGMIINSIWYWCADQV